METFRFELVSPESLLKDTTAGMVIVPGMDGDFGVLPGHSPMMSTIRPGIVEIHENESSDAERLFVKGGLAQVTPTGLTILAEEIIHLSDVDIADLESDITNARQSLDAAVDDIDKARAERELGWMEALSQVMSH